jgi:quinol monooxygenase YgiN
MSSVVSWNLRLSVRDGRHDDVRPLMQEMVESTRAEPGTLAYEWFLSPDGSVCHICERYADSAAVVAHIGHFGTAFAERFLGCLEPTSFHVYGEASDEARAMLDGLGAVYLGTLGGFNT